MAQVSTARRAPFCKSTCCKTFTHFTCTVHLTDRSLGNFPWSEYFKEHIALCRFSMQSRPKKRCTWAILHLQDSPKPHWSSTCRMMNHWLYNHDFIGSIGDFYSSSVRIVCNLASKCSRRKPQSFRSQASATHIIAQEKGKSDWYESYATRICRVERDYTFQRNIVKPVDWRPELAVSDGLLDGDICWWCKAACGTWRPYVVLNFTICWMIKGCGLCQTSSWHSRKRGKHLEVNMIIPIWSRMTKLLSASRMRAYVPLNWSIPGKSGDFAGKRWRRFAGLPWEYVLFLTRIFLPNDMFH